MELRHLRYFLAVADELHFGRASRRLHVSQPSVSQQIQQLEQELGSPLFDRVGRRIRLTAAGEQFRGYASRALEDVFAGQRALRAMQKLEAGTLRVGYPGSLTTSIVVPAIAAVMRKYPGLHVTADEGPVGRVERRLAHARLDVGLGFAPSREPDVEAEPVFESRLGLVVSRRHALASATRVSVHQLSGEPLALLSRGMRGRARADAFFASARFTPRIAFETNAVATVLAVVRAGLAVAVLPEPRFSETDRVAVVALSPAPETHFAALLWRRGSPRSAAATAFADEVRALAHHG